MPWYSANKPKLVSTRLTLVNPIVRSLIVGSLALVFSLPKASARAENCSAVFNVRVSRVLERPEVFNTITSIHGWMGDLVKPRPAIIFPGHQGRYENWEPAYSAKFNLIALSKLDTYVQPAHHAAVVAHEYGHAILTENLNVPSHLPYDRELARRHERLGRQLMESIKGNDYELQDRYFESVDAAEKRMRDNYLVYISKSRHHKGLDELFADTVAVLDSGDPAAMGFVRRSFDREIEVSDFRVITRKGHLENVHAIYDPSRSYLWKRYLKNLPPQERGRTLQILIGAIGREIQKMNQITDPAQKTDEALNLSFMEELDRSFSGDHR